MATRATSPRPPRGSVYASKHPRPCTHCGQPAAFPVLALVAPTPSAVLSGSAPAAGQWRHQVLCPAHYEAYLKDAGYRWPTEALTQTPRTD
jgi:hypothetical protein